MDRMIDIGTKLAAVVVIPLLLWGVKLEVDNAVTKSELAAVRAEVHRLETQNQAVLSAVQENTLTLRELSTTMTYVRGRLDEVLADRNNRNP